ncbi:NUDIX hydrolase [Micromonospora sp. NPDC050980]|uniref:NUDIX hydrolase n=1 Tax=Micromonospora sp. NPDC050980 TaxID=3155161 RepID=UPI0033C50181
MLSEKPDIVGARRCGRVGLPGFYRACMPSDPHDFTVGLPRKRMAAGLLITDPQDRVLLVEPAYQAWWEIPGGCVEDGESPWQAVVRECREELGLDLTPGRLLVVDWVPAGDGRTDGVMLVFDGGALDAVRAQRIVVPPAELKGWAWSDPPQARARLQPLLARRVAECLQARGDGVTRYLEDGVPVS